MNVSIWWLLLPVLPSAILSMIFATYRWKRFTADQIKYQVDASSKRSDAWMEQLAMQRMRALVLTLDDDPEFIRRAGFEP